MTAEEINFLIDSDSDRRDRQASNAIFVLAATGWLIIGSTLNSIIFNSFPIRLLAPEWQLGLIAALLSSGFAFLVGSALIVLAFVLNPDDPFLQNWQRSLSRLASFYAVLVILFIPLQCVQGFRALNNQTNISLQSVQNLKTVVKGIAAVNSEFELRSYVATLPDAPALPAKFDAEFPVIKQRAIDNINAQINAALSRIEIQKREGLQTFLKEAVRNAAQSILFAAAFSALACISGRGSNAVTRIFDYLV